MKYGHKVIVIAITALKEKVNKINTINKKTEKLSVRVTTGAVICIAICAILLFSGVDWFLNTVIACFCLQAIFELYRATGAANNRILYGISCLIAAVISYISIPYYEVVTAILFVAAVSLFFLSDAEYQTNTVDTSGSICPDGMLDRLFL